jgi:hypothetical protein
MCEQIYLGMDGMEVRSYLDGSILCGFAQNELFSAGLP